jgi:hypothetical protein
MLAQRIGSKATKEKLPASAHILCGWPLLLVIIGGLLEVYSVAYGTMFASKLK